MTEDQQALFTDALNEIADRATTCRTMASAKQLSDETVARLNGKAAAYEHAGTVLRSAIERAGREVRP